MPANKNALLRYKTIDNCLRNPYRRWTLDDLVKACSEALYEFEGIRKGVSVRTVQLDIQMMRSEKLGYNAPIEVYEQKYYRYADPDYSITNLPLSTHDYELMTEAVQLLSQFYDFDHFTEMADVVGRLQDNLALSRGERRPIVDFERNPNLTGLKYLNPLYRYIARKTTLRLRYKPFERRSARLYTVSPYLLKEYNNRWFLCASATSDGKLSLFALDRIQGIEPLPDVPYRENPDFVPADYFSAMIGVTRGVEDLAETIRFRADRSWAPYIETKPIHASQRVVDKSGDREWVTFEVSLIVNKEFYAHMLSFGPGVQLLSPDRVVRHIRSLLQASLSQYDGL